MACRAKLGPARLAPEIRPIIGTVAGSGKFNLLRSQRQTHLASLQTCKVAMGAGDRGRDE